ncbi:hypothetical protein [Mesorhizobium loti]|uniref:hypothetical protein n=1 Tax=Rhizobium loti TaxID=381 RepID=UPI001267E240|nr:hypothetical protein [Mesorhizobium loti]
MAYKTASAAGNRWDLGLDFIAVHLDPAKGFFTGFRTVGLPAFLSHVKMTGPTSSASQLFAALAMEVCLASLALAQEGRALRGVALVIGNSAYENLPSLRLLH